MNQYVLLTLIDYSIDEERLKVLEHTPYLFKNFHSLLVPIKSMKEGGFMYIKRLIKKYNWDKGLRGWCCRSLEEHLQKPITQP